MAPRVAIVYWSMYGHIAKLAQAEKAGIEAAGGTVDVFQIAETLPEEVLTKMVSLPVHPLSTTLPLTTLQHAPPKDSSIPTIKPNDMTKYDAFLFGIPTRYGNYSAQWKTFIDALGHLWQTGALYGKYFGLFVSTGTMGGGQETTAITALSSWVHQGMIYVPLGYATTFNHMAALSEARGGSPWGAGTFSAADGSRQPSDTELAIAKQQGEDFWKAVSKVSFA
jgi:NAD(P)H dehydrogenase (quinone)